MSKESFDYGKEIARSLNEGTAVVGAVGETLWERTEKTRELLWYQLTAPLRARKVRRSSRARFR